MTSFPSLEGFRAATIKFFNLHLSRYPRSVWGTLGSSIYQDLIESAIVPAIEGVMLRRPSLCLDNTPVVYSQSLATMQKRQDDREGMTFRLLVEPGGTGITVAKQVDVALLTADRIIQRLNWQAAISDLNGLVARVFPDDASVLQNWWGGIWLGLAVSLHSLQLRLYLNLRHGNAHARWQRFADVMGFLGDETLGDLLQRLASTVAPFAIPVGVGVVLSENRVAALRLYVGVYHPTQETIKSLLIDSNERKDQVVVELFESFGTLIGLSKSQSVTIGYDFFLDNHGIILPLIERVKIDVCCQFMSEDCEPELYATLSRFAQIWQLDIDPLKFFVADLVESFGGYRTEFVSFSLSGESPGITVYAKPDGYPLD